MQRKTRGKLTLITPHVGRESSVVYNVVHVIVVEFELNQLAYRY